MYIDVKTGKEINFGENVKFSETTNEGNAIVTTEISEPLTEENIKFYIEKGIIREELIPESLTDFESFKVYISKCCDGSLREIYDVWCFGTDIINQAGRYYHE